MLRCAGNKNMNSHGELELCSNSSQHLNGSVQIFEHEACSKDSEDVDLDIVIRLQALPGADKTPPGESNQAIRPHDDKSVSKHPSSEKEEGYDVPAATPCLQKLNVLDKCTPFDNVAINCPQTFGSEVLDKVIEGSRAQSNTDLLRSLSRSGHRGLQDVSNNKLKDANESHERDHSLLGNEMSESFISARSKTMPTLSRPKMTPQKVPSMSEGERLTKAKEIVERAIKFKKVFTIQGGYSTIRHSLRRRGWVEKFYKIPVPQKKPPVVKKQKSSDEEDNDFDDDVVDDDDDDDDDVDNDQPKIPPWEEEDGIYGIMSRMVRSVTPSLFWVLKRDAIDYRYLSKDQMVNHYCKAGSFTTKVGLCVNMKNVVWFDNCDHDTFFPRCYRLSHDEERDAFIDDYRLTACMNIIKVALKQQNSWKHPGDEAKNKTQSCSNSECNTPKRGCKIDKCVCVTAADENITIDVTAPEPAPVETLNDEDWQPAITQLAAIKKKNKQRFEIPIQVLETAIYQCEKFLASKDHEDIDVPREVGQLTDQQWDDLIKWYYQLVQEEGTFVYIPLNLAKQCESLTRRLASHCPQFDMDGIRNVWIVKPGAKSRGRGIICYEKLEDMLKLVSTQVVKKDGKYVVQKYIERPLLIYNTKFDIRQWFLVTDWNPLTLWFYRDSYLRFCSQQFTLEDFDQSIHLSNNAIQKHYKNGPRSVRLPEENMWTNEEFKKYLASKKHPDVWDEKIYPQMKRAIVCALLVTQDLVEYRKSSFELYGADFMLTEDFRPWLIEINSSPSMESSTSVTAKLCAAVLDDTIKVIVDRKFDRNCDIGRFELAYKQPLVTVPPYIGISLCVEGQAVKKPGWAARPSRESEPNGRSTEPGGNDNLFTPRTVTTKSTFSERLLEYSKSMYSNIPTPNATSTSAASADAKAVKKDSFRIPEVNPKNVSTQFSRSIKEVSAKVSTFRAPCEIEKIKANAKSGSGSGNDSSGASTEQKGNSSGEESAQQGKKPNKIIENKNTEDGKGGLIDTSNTASKTGDSMSEVLAQNGPVLTQQTQTRSNPQAMPGQNQRRYVMKSSGATNCTISGTAGAERGGQNRNVPVSNVKSSVLQTCKPNSKGNTNPSVGSWNRACQWCGRGGNLHLDSADPNCHCQKDSVLISMQLGQANTRTQDLIILNNQQIVPKTWQGHSKMKRGKNPQNGALATSGYLVDGDENGDSKASTPLPYSSCYQAPVRPASALSDRLDCFTTNINPKVSRPHKMRKSISLASHPRDGIMNVHYHNQQQLDELSDLSDHHQQQQQQNQSDGFSGNLQSFTSYHQHYNTKPLHRQRHRANQGLLGSMLTTRVRNFLAKKSSPNTAIINLWPSMAYLDSNRCQSPLSVIAQRQLPLKQQK